VDDFFVAEGGCRIDVVTVDVIEDGTWQHGGVLEIAIRRDDGNRPAPLENGIIRLWRGPFVRVDTGDTYFGRRNYFYVAQDVGINLPAGHYWLGPRNPQAVGAGTNYWQLSDGGPDGMDTNTGYFSLDGGITFQNEGSGWQHNFALDPEPLGACCLSSGACLNLTPRYACRGLFRAGEDCENLDPPCGTGACCEAGGACTDRTPEGDCIGRYAAGGFCMDLHPPCFRPPSCEGRRLSAENPRANEWFGFDLAVDGTQALVGAPRDRDFGSSAGAVYVYEQERSGDWGRTGKLFPHDPTAESQFGRAVARSGRFAAVGAPYLGSGAVYLFERTGLNWREVAKIDAPSSSLRFGAGVALDHDVLCVGDPISETSRGQATIYERDEQGTWRSVARLRGDEPLQQGQFGIAVAVRGDVVVVGAWIEDTRYNEGGAAYVFQRQADGRWTRVARLTAAEFEQTAGHFGAAIAITSEFLAIGEPGYAFRQTSTGAVYVFEPVSPGQPWVRTARLTDMYGRRGDEFGAALSARNQLLWVGAPYADASARDSGTGTLFRRIDSPTPWVQVAHYLVADGSYLDGFGAKGAIADSSVLISIPFDDRGVSAAGSVAVFGLSCPDFDDSGTVDLADHRLFYDCLTGPGVRVTEECLRPDLDFDGDADLTDFRILQAGFESPP
jgi:hypothetical protein